MRNGRTKPGDVVAVVGAGPVGLSAIMTAAELRLQDLWIKDIAITTGLVSATTTPMLLKPVAQGKLHPERFVSHRFGLGDIIDAYDTFGRAAETKALKVALSG